MQLEVKCFHFLETFGLLFLSLPHALTLLEQLWVCSEVVVRSRSLRGLVD